MEKHNQVTVDEFKKRAFESLQAAVEYFNMQCAEWNTTFGCNANFRWDYRNGTKTLTISEITMPILTSEPNEADIKNAEDVLSGANTAGNTNYSI